MHTERALTRHWVAMPAVADHFGARFVADITLPAFVKLYVVDAPRAAGRSAASRPLRRDHSNTPCPSAQGETKRSLATAAHQRDPVECSQRRRRPSRDTFCPRWPGPAVRTGARDGTAPAPHAEFKYVRGHHARREGRRAARARAARRARAAARIDRQRSHRRERPVGARHNRFSRWRAHGCTPFSLSFLPRGSH